MRDKLIEIKNKFFQEIKGVKSPEDLDNLEINYLGRKRGELTLVIKNMKDLSLEERPLVGKLINEVKKEIEEKISNQRNLFKKGLRKDEKFFDITLPGKKIERGHFHPLTHFLRRVNSIFTAMGFEIIEGPEVETEEYNFDLLNIPQDHPARDMWDTYYIKSPKSQTQGQKLLLRTHTSPMQIRAMENRKPPVRLIVPGRVFRHEATDAGHETTFYQCEGLVINKNIRVTDLIGTLKVFLQEIFGQEVKIRVRPAHYPFVEPGMDIDMSCLLCGGKGCPLCKQVGWLEMLGSGMVHPIVLKNMKIDPNKYSGFAFGMGIDRLMLLYYGINDIRLSYGGDLRFVRQF